MMIGTNTMFRFWTNSRAATMLGIILAFSYQALQIFWFTLLVILPVFAVALNFILWFIGIMTSTL